MILTEDYNNFLGDKAMLIGRKKEVELLNELYGSDSAELVALYGRRRVGKTFLVSEVFRNRITFRHAGLSPVDSENDDDSKRKSRMKDQLKHFARSLTMSGVKGAKTPSSWLDAFYMLEDYLQGIDDGTTRQLVFIDEIQWMDTPKSGFMTGFEAFWNGWACYRQNIMVIVCGSSTSWVLDKVINNHGGLYGRVTRQIRLLPFSLRECEEFFQSADVVFSRYDITQAYMMVGGIPYYLNYFEKTLSLPQNIDAVFFSDDAPLADEFDRLFASLFSNATVMKAIITALSTKNIGLTRNEIVHLTGISDSGEFSRYLKALMEGGFILKYCPYGNSKRDEYYKLSDPFCIFYLRFVRENRSKRISWDNLADSAQVVTWKGYAFENVCFNHTKQIKAALGISGVVTNESAWFSKGEGHTSGAQIDMIIDRNDNIVHLCEMKFYSDQFRMNKDDHFALIRRQNVLREKVPKKASIRNTMISTYGLVHNEYSGDYIYSITLDDLFV